MRPWNHAPDAQEEVEIGDRGASSSSARKVSLYRTAGAHLGLQRVVAGFRSTTGKYFLETIIRITNICVGL